MERWKVMNTNRAKDIYETVVKPLSLPERLKILELTAHDLAAESPGSSIPKQHHIMELKGLGKELWQGINARQYIDELRNEYGIIK